MDFTKLQEVLKDEQGRYRTISLFWELRHQAGNYEPVFTLKPYDLQKEDKLYPSLKKIYMTYDHIPNFEYEFAQDVFGSWDHWIKLTGASLGVKETIQEWRDELDIRIKAQSLKAMMIASRDNDAKGVNAAKYLAEKGYAQKRGRPSKEEVERERKIQAGAHKELADDMERIGLKIVEGGK